MGKDNDRELIGTVTLSDGTVVEIRMPLTGDILDGMPTGKSHLEVMVCAATGMGWDEFRRLPAPDGTAILNKLGTAMDSINVYLNNVNRDQKLN